MNLQHSILSLRIFFFISFFLSFFFFFLYRWNPAQRSWRMEKPRIFPGGLVSLDEKPCNSSRHLWFVHPFSFASLRFMHAYIIVPAWNFQVSFIHFFFFFFRCAMLACLAKTPKGKRIRSEDAL